MRKIKSGLGEGKQSHEIVVLQNATHYHGLIKANQLLLLVASSLMLVVFILGFFLLPAGNMLDDFAVKNEVVANNNYAVKNPVISAEINNLKGQLVGLVSGSIESKLRMLEESIRTGKVTSSLGTIQDLKNDVRVLQAYSMPERKVSVAPVPVSEDIIKEISQLKNLIYLTLVSCGLLIAAIGGIWVRNRFKLSDDSDVRKAELGSGK